MQSAKRNKIASSDANQFFRLKESSKAPSLLLEEGTAHDIARTFAFE